MVGYRDITKVSNETIRWVKEGGRDQIHNKIQEFMSERMGDFSISIWLPDDKIYGSGIVRIVVPDDEIHSDDRNSRKVTSWRDYLKDWSRGQFTGDEVSIWLSWHLPHSDLVDVLDFALKDAPEELVNIINSMFS